MIAHVMLIYKQQNISPYDEVGYYLLSPPDSLEAHCHHSPVRTKFGCRVITVFKPAVSSFRATKVPILHA